MRSMKRYLAMPFVVCTTMFMFLSSGIDFVEVDPVWYDNGVKTGCLTNWENFRQIYSLKLPKNTKQAVLDAVKIIEQHPYVRAAEPNYIVYCEPCI